MSQELQELIISFFREEYLPDRESFDDDGDIAMILDLLIEQGFLEKK